MGPSDPPHHAQCITGTAEPALAGQVHQGLEIAFHVSLILAIISAVLGQSCNLVAGIIKCYLDQARCSIIQTLVRCTPDGGWCGTGSRVPALSSIKLKDFSRTFPGLSLDFKDILTVLRHGLS